MAKNITEKPKILEKLDLLTEMFCFEPNKLVKIAYDELNWGFKPKMFELSQTSILISEKSVNHSEKRFDK